MPWIYCRRMPSFFIPLWYLWCWFSVEVLKIPRWHTNSMKFWKNVVSLRQVMRRNLCGNSRRLICTKFYGKWQHDVKEKYFWGKTFYRTEWPQHCQIKAMDDTKTRQSFEQDMYYDHFNITRPTPLLEFNILTVLKISSLSHWYVSLRTFRHKYWTLLCGSSSRSISCTNWQHDV